jgi:predicted transglutaminase-like cysteine proteinase
MAEARENGKMQLRSIGSLLRSIAAFALLAPLLAARPACALVPEFSHYGEVSFDDLLRLPQWQRVAAELPAEEAEVRACIAAACGNSEAAQFAALVSSLAGQQRRSQLERVHAFFNAKPYRDDQEQFGRKDYWQTPLAFAAHGGDCEDYAIAKYFALKLLGYRDDELRIAVMVNADRSEVHAVLLVAADGQWVVLDNRARGLRSVSSYDGWAPQYAVTEARGWRYLSESRPVTIAAVPGRSISPASR